MTRMAVDAPPHRRFFELSGRFAFPGIAIVAVGIVLVQSQDMDGISGSYPRALAGIVGTLAAISLVGDLFLRRGAFALSGGEDRGVDSASGAEAEKSSQLDNPRVKQMCSVAGAMAVATILVSSIGMLAAIGVLLLVCPVLMGSRSWFRIATVAALGPLICYVVFVDLLLVRLPVGPWGW